MLKVSIQQNVFFFFDWKNTAFTCWSLTADDFIAKITLPSEHQYETITQDKHKQHTVVQVKGYATGIFATCSTLDI